MPSDFSGRAILAEDLGNNHFKNEYGVKYAYYSGSMYKGISSVDLVIAMAKAQLLAFFGTGGLQLAEIKRSINFIKTALDQDQTFGANILAALDDQSHELAVVNLYIEAGVSVVEASAFMQVTPALVKYRLKGLCRREDGSLYVPNRIIAKVSHPKVADAFMRPPPTNIVEKLVASGDISEEEAALSGFISVASDISVESDSGGHTDQAVSQVILPSIQLMRDRIMDEYMYETRIRVGAAGGLGAPQAVAAAFFLGADFVVTGSVNQCSLEADISDYAKDLLQNMGVEDTAYAPAGDMFELGAKVQVLKKGTFFPARANKLYELYQRFESIESIDERTQETLQKKYFKRSFDAVWQETREFYERRWPDKLLGIEKSPKKKMAHIFKWYFIHSSRLSKSGSKEDSIDFQVHCGPALGVFNQWVKNTEIENWRNRSVSHIAHILMEGAAEVVSNRVADFQSVRESSVKN